jgi:neuronal PAS domain-containing protein 1/3
VETTGSSVFDYVHTADHAELAEQLGLTLASTSQSGQGQSSSQGMNHHHLHSPPSPASATGSVDDGNSSMNPDGTSEEHDDSGGVLMGLFVC